MKERGGVVAVHTWSYFIPPPLFCEVGAQASSCKRSVDSAGVGKGNLVKRSKKNPPKPFREGKKGILNLKFYSPSN